MASGDGSGWGSSSGCENQGSRARKGATVDTGDSGSGKERTAVAKAAVTQGSVVMRARQCVAQSGLSHAGHWLAQEVALATAQAKTGEGRRWCDRKAKPHPLFISQLRQSKSLFRCVAKIFAMLASPEIQILNIKMKIKIILTK